MFSRLLHFLVLASTILATTASYLIKYGPDNSKCLEATTENAMLRDCKSSSSSWTTTAYVEIQSSNSTDNCLGTDGGGKGDLKIISCSSESDVLPWTYDANSHQYIFLLHDHSKKACMDLKDGDLTQKVLLWDCNSNSTNQQWSVPVMTHLIQYEQDKSKCLESIKGGEVRVDACTNNTHWTTVGDSYTSQIHSGTPGETEDICLHVKWDVDLGKYEGQEIIQGPCSGLEPAGAWTYDSNSRQYKFPAEDLCMEVPDGDYPKEAKAQKCDINKTNQRWIRIPLN